MSITTAILTALPAFMAAVLACIVAWRGKTQAKKTHELVNSRMSELLALTRSAGRAQGVLEGRKDAASENPPAES